MQHTHSNLKPVQFSLATRIFGLSAQVKVIESCSWFPWFSKKRRTKFFRSAQKRKMVLESLTYTYPPQVLGTEQASAEDFKKKLGHSILIICTHAPTRKHAGGLRILDILHLIKSKSPGTYIEVFTSNFDNAYGSIQDLKAIADDVILTDHYNFSLKNYIHNRKSNIAKFDLVDFQFAQPIEVIRSYRQIADRLIFTPMESLVRCEVINRSISAEEAEKSIQLNDKDALEEVAISEFVDQTICVSKEDEKALSAFSSGAIISIETGVSTTELGEQPPQEKSSKENLEVAYLAYFGSGTNQVALSWYLKEVHPIVCAAVPAYILSLIGRGDISQILNPMPDQVRYVGEVDDLVKGLQTAIVGIAPALSGSGFRGKINQYAYLNIPSVASSLASQGLEYEHGVSIFSAKDTQDFAECLITLLTQPKVRAKMVKEAQYVCQQYYSWSAKWPQIEQAYGLADYTRKRLN